MGELTQGDETVFFAVRAFKSGFKTRKEVAWDLVLEEYARLWVLDERDRLGILRCWYKLWASGYIVWCRKKATFKRARIDFLYLRLEGDDSHILLALEDLFPIE
jgi:hypothetical protein